MTTSERLGERGSELLPDSVRQLIARCTADTMYATC